MESVKAKRSLRTSPVRYHGLFNLYAFSQRVRFARLSRTPPLQLVSCGLKAIPTSAVVPTSVAAACSSLGSHSTRDIKLVASARIPQDDKSRGIICSTSHSNEQRIQPAPCSISENTKTTHFSGNSAQGASLMKTAVISPKHSSWMDNITIKSTPVRKTLSTATTWKTPRKEKELRTNLLSPGSMEKTQKKRNYEELSELNLEDYKVLMVDKKKPDKKRIPSSTIFFHRGQKAQHNPHKKICYFVNLHGKTENIICSGGGSDGDGDGDDRKMSSAHNCGRPTHLDPCPVIQKLGSSKIGDQLYISQEWESRPGICDPRITKIFASSGNSVSYLLQNGIATIGAKVFYCDSHKIVKAEGWITNEGILCSRCGFVVGCREFKLCAGVKDNGSGKHLLLLSSGLPLIQLTNKLKSSAHT